MRRIILPPFVLGLVSLSQFAFAQTTVTTDPVGFVQPFNTTANQINCLANSDTYVALPFTRIPEFTGAVASVSGNVITVSGSPNWTSGQFVYAAGTQPKTYFVLIGPHSTTNPKEGRMYTVTANGPNSLTVNLNGDDISGVQSGTQVVLIPYSTLATVFPASDANVSFVPTTSAFNPQTKILIPNYAGTGINISANVTYFFLNGGWRRIDRPSTEPHDDDILPNGGYFIVRNPGTGTTLTMLGGVLTKKLTLPLRTQTSSQQDNFVSLSRPVDVKLNDLGLISSGAFAPTSSAFNPTDKLLVFNNAVAAINKSASLTYYYFNNAWRRVDLPSTTDAGNDVIRAGSGFIIRKAATVDGASAFWQNAATY